jgi:hypothetical protein
MTLLEMLIEFEKRDLGDLPEYTAGNWTRRNLEAIIRDLEWELTHASPTVR